MANTFSFEDAQKPLPAAAAKPAGPATFSFEEATAPKPGLLDDIGTGLISAGGKVLGALDKGAVALSDLLPDGTPLKMSPEDRAMYAQRGAVAQQFANEHAPERWTGQVASGLVYAPLGAAAPAVMGGAEGTARSQLLQDQGVDAATANKAGLGEGALMAGVGLLPLGSFIAGQGARTLATTAATSVAKAAAAGGVQSVASDAMTKAFLESGGYDEQAKNFTPSLERAAEGALFMGAFHGGMQGAHVAAGKVFNAATGRATPDAIAVPDAALGLSVPDQLRAVRPPEAPIVPGAVPRADLQAAKDASVAQAKAADPVATADTVMAAPTIEDAARAADAIINAPLPDLKDTATGAQDAQIADALHAVDGLGRSAGIAGELGAGTGEPTGTAGLADGAGLDDQRPAAGTAPGGVDGVPVADGSADAQPALSEPQSAPQNIPENIQEPVPILSRLDQARQKIARQEEVVQQALDNIAQRNAAKGAAVQETMPAAEMPVPAAVPKSRLTPLEHPDLADPDTRAELAHMATEAGWAQVGGQMIRADGTDQTSQVTGRTPWIPKQPWYQMLPERLNEHDTKIAVGKALNGEPLTAKQKRVVANMLDFAKSSVAEQQKWRDQAYHETGAADAQDYEAIGRHADQVDARDADIPIDPHDTRLASADHLTDEDIDAIFGIQPASRSLPEKPVSADAREGGQGTDAAQAAGPGAFRLEAETPDQVRARTAADEAAQAESRKAAAAADAQERAAQDAKDVRQRAAAAADNFRLGEDPHDALTGQNSLFDHAPTHDDGADIPPAFWKKVKVPHDVWIADEGVHEKVDLPAHQAIASVREDIGNLEALLNCLKG